MWRPRRLAALMILGVLAAACGAAGDPGTTLAPVAPSTSTTLPGDRLTTTTTAPAMTGEVPEQFLQAVLADAAERAGVPADQLEVTRSEAVEWPDGSLGCPRRGEAYIQLIIPGYRVEISGPGGPYDYRLDGRGNFRLCEQDLPIGG